MYVLSSLYKYLCSIFIVIRPKDHFWSPQWHLYLWNIKFLLKQECNYNNKRNSIAKSHFIHQSFNVWKTNMQVINGKFKCQRWKKGYRNPFPNWEKVIWVFIKICRWMFGLKLRRKVYNIAPLYFYLTLRIFPAKCLPSSLLWRK